MLHDDIVTWKGFLHYWPIVRGIHWSPMDSHHQRLVTCSLMLVMLLARSCWTNRWFSSNLNRHVMSLLQNCHNQYWNIVVDIICQSLASRINWINAHLSSIRNLNDVNLWAISREMTHILIIKYIWVRSWNNGTCCMSFYILSETIAFKWKLHFLESINWILSSMNS